eukprot:CAMPEP_0198574992 /NCGR_PEP_ID=MMETSP1462-20131121/115523_1 /TAXON_ID=1333877 /ORGANISM="Brandtodinium nutriculum, Strain RCC3387" /LENGTH=93 /DNA_ID=CAMNT_0044306223 /DNA_START=38 /DNA_END=315 /DNA_ORIENTATION=-
MHPTADGFQEIVKLLCKEHETLSIQIKRLVDENRTLRLQVQDGSPALESSTWTSEGAVLGDFSVEEAPSSSNGRQPLWSAGAPLALPPKAIVP